MKILSVITGIGYGHLIRQQAILEELKKRNGDIVIASYGNGFDFFSKKYPALEIDGPKLPEKNFEFSTFRTLLLNLKLPYYYIKNFIKLKRLIKAFNPDVIISDFEPIGLYLSKKKINYLVFNFDPLLYKQYINEGNKNYWPQSKYIFWIYNRAKKINAQILIPSFEKHESKKYTFVNPIVRPLPQDSPKELLEKLNLKSPPILIMFGGSHFATNLLYKIQEVLSSIPEQDFIIFTYKLVGQSHDNVKFLQFKENFLEYLKASKGIITQAGHSTLSEAIVLKKPSLLFPIPNYIEQAVNAYFAKKSGISIVENPKHLSEEDLLKIIRKFIKELPLLEDNLEDLDLKPNGAKQIADIIEEATI